MGKWKFNNKTQVYADHCYGGETIYRVREEYINTKNGKIKWEYWMTGSLDLGYSEEEFRGERGLKSAIKKIEKRARCKDFTPHVAKEITC